MGSRNAPAVGGNRHGGILEQIVEMQAVGADERPVEDRHRHLEPDGVLEEIRWLLTVTPNEIEHARAYAYGGSHVPDLGYFPLGNVLFTNLVHYVRSSATCNTSKRNSVWMLRPGIVGVGDAVAVLDA